MNAFERVKPRGVDAPVAIPRRTNTSKAPARGLVLNCRGLLQAPLQGRSKNAIDLEGQTAGRKSTDKRSKLKKAAI